LDGIDRTAKVEALVGVIVQNRLQPPSLLPVSPPVRRCGDWCVRFFGGMPTIPALRWKTAD